MNLRGGGVLGGALALAFAAVALVPAPAPAAVYWAEYGIGAANLDGTEPNSRYFKPPFPADSAGPECGLAVNATHLYWVGAFGIGRVNFDGPASPATVVGGMRRPCGIALTDSHLYWASREDGTISRANLDGTEARVLLTGLNGPCNVAAAGGYLYWLDWSGIGRVNLDGTEPEPGFVGTVGGCGLAVNAGHVYWGEYGRIGRANLDGSEADPDFIAGIGSVASIAVDSAHLYWTDRPEGMAYPSVARANLDGSGVVRSWIPTTRFELGGIAVDARPSPPPLPLPSQPIRFGQVRHNQRVGSAVVDVWVPERGDLHLIAPRLGWKLLKGPEPPPSRFGSFRWRLKIWPGPYAKGKNVRKQLRNRGLAKVALRLSYAEEGQLPYTAVKRLTLRKKKKL